MRQRNITTTYDSNMFQLVFCCSTSLLSSLSFLLTGLIENFWPILQTKSIYFFTNWADFINRHCLIGPNDTLKVWAWLVNPSERSWRTDDVIWPVDPLYQTLARFARSPLITISLRIPIHIFDARCNVGCEQVWTEYLSPSKISTPKISTLWQFGILEGSTAGDTSYFIGRLLLRLLSCKSSIRRLRVNVQSWLQGALLVLRIAQLFQNSLHLAVAGCPPSHELAVAQFLSLSWSVIRHPVILYVQTKIKHGINSDPNPMLLTYYRSL